MTGSGGEEGVTLEYTPTWVVAAVCMGIVGISFFVERLLHYSGKYLKRKNQKSLFEAMQKVKEELMLLGFISLLLTVSQGELVKICVHKHAVLHLLPCTLPSSSPEDNSSHSKPKTTSHFRHLLSEGSGGGGGYCGKKNKVPLLSLEALHNLHIFIFILAVVHVIYSVLTVVSGGAKIRQWKKWEDSIAEDNFDAGQVLKPKVTNVYQQAFIRNRFLGLGMCSAIIVWLQCFFKQFYGSVTKTDYVALRLGFIMTHCRGNPKFNFHRYMIRALEDDFKKVVGISWYLWVFVIIFLLLNINGWHTYFWIAFVPVILLLAVGTKLEHVISQLAQEVAEKHEAIEDDLVVHPSDNHFWFHRPRVILLLIHFILFQNAFEIAFFFWIWAQFGFESCIMDNLRYIIPRLVIGVFIQITCSYSTLPLYALVTQMGTHFKKSIFDEHIQAGLLGWAHKAKMRTGLKAATHGLVQVKSGSSGGSTSTTHGTQLVKIARNESTPRPGGSMATTPGTQLARIARNESAPTPGKVQTLASLGLR